MNIIEICTAGGSQARGVVAIVGGTAFHSSCGLSSAFSFACVLFVVHPGSLKILRVEIRLEKYTVK